MRASWTDINGRKIVVTNVHEVREFQVDNEDKIEFRAPLDSAPMGVFLDNYEVFESHKIYEMCRFIDTEVILSADKE